MKRIFYLLLISFVLISCSEKKEQNENNCIISIARGKSGAKDSYCSYLFNSSREIIYFTDKYIYPFECGYSVASDGINNEAIDYKGKKLFSYKVISVYDWFYSEGYYTCYDNKNYETSYYVNRKNRKINLQPSHPVKDGYCAQYDLQNHKMCYKTPRGKYLTTKNKEIYYSEYCADFSNGYAVVGEKNQYGIINLFAEQIVDKKYSFIGNLKYNYATASKEGNKKEYLYKTEPLYGIIDMQGSWILEPKYYEAIAISGSEIAVKTTSIENKNNCGWEIINLKNQKIYTYAKNIDLQSDFETGEIFYDREAVFSFSDTPDKFGIINTEGKILLSLICDRIEPFPDNGYWQVLIDNRWMLFKADEGILNPEEYLDFSKVK